MKFTENDIKDLVEMFPEAKTAESFFSSHIHVSRENTNKLLKFIKGLNKKHNTNFFDQVAPTDEQLDSTKLSNIKLNQDLVELQNAGLAAQRGRPQDRSKLLEIFRKFWPNIEISGI